jgi:methyl-accepting chemotaxis protein
MAGSVSVAPPHGAHQKAKRGSVWLVNKRFQLKYTFMLVGVVLTVACGLGLVVGSMVQTALHHADVATASAERAHKENEVNNKLARDNAVLAAGDNPNILRLMEGSIAEAEEKSAEELNNVRHAGAELKQSARYLQMGLVASILALGIALTLIGLRMTQRIVGPVHRLKRLLRRVGTGKLTVGERLRKGDELEDLFDTFRQMTFSLMALQRGRLATLEATLKDAQATKADRSVRDGLIALRAQLELGLGVEAALKRSGELRALSMPDAGEVANVVHAKRASRPPQGEA